MSPINYNKCPRCREHVNRTKYIKTVECRAAGKVGNRYGMLYVQVGANYIGKRYRVIMEEMLD